MKRFWMPLGLALAALNLLATGTLGHAGERSIQAVGRGFLDADNQSGPDLRGPGEGDHLGKCELRLFLEAIDPNSNTLVPRYLWVLAANGDVLAASVDLEFDAETGMIAGTITFIGFTGRFADATGSARLLIVPDTYWLDSSGFPINGTQFTWALDGTIDY